MFTKDGLMFRSVRSRVSFNTNGTPYNALHSPSSDSDYVV